MGRTKDRVRPVGEDERRTAAAVASLHEQVRKRTGLDLPLRLWDGTSLGPPDAGYRIVLNHPWSLRRLLLPSGAGTLFPPWRAGSGQDLAAGEAYVEGDIDLEGDIVAAMRIGERLDRADFGVRDFMRLVIALVRLPSPPAQAHGRRARLTGEPHSPERDRAAIAFHYDLPQDFYVQFLDRRLVYSCAYFSSPDEDLDTAQERKLDLICRKLRLRPGMRLLDIGCGWGSLLLHAADRYGVEGLGVTLSRTQAEAGRERIAAAGLADRVEIRLADYRELSGSWDAVASVGMFEHVGPKHYPEYFGAAYRLTAPGGLFLNHGICSGDPRNAAHETTGTFVGTYVFPDGGLAPAWRAVQETEQAGFELIDVEQLRPHYALTLRRWMERLETNHDRVVAAASETDYRIWRAYMAGSAISFEGGSLGVIQVLGSKGHALPLGRAWLRT